MRRSLASWSLFLSSLALSPTLTRAEEPKLEPPQRVIVRPVGTGVIETIIVAADAPTKGQGTAKNAPAKPAAPVRKAVAQVLVSGGNGGLVRAAPAGQTAVLDAVDPQDPRVRFLVLTPRGPVIVEASLTIDGQPFRLAREKLVDAMFAAADTNLDGQATWEEALDHPRFADGQYRQVAGNPEQRKQVLRTLDTNGDGMMDRAEVRRLVAQRTGGESFNLPPNFGQSTPDLLPLIDQDSDGALSLQECLAASQRLKSRDANDDDLVDLNELLGQVDPYGPSGQVVRNARFSRGQSLALRIDPGFDAAALHAQLVQRYRPEGILRPQHFGLSPRTGEQLDANQNAALEPAELAALAKAAPQVELEGNFGRTGALPAGLIVKRVAEDLGDSAKVLARNGLTTTLTLPGVSLELIGNLQLPQLASYGSYATQLLNQFDADKNGYLEKKEVMGNIGQQFNIWDEDGDGKLFAAEITAFYERQFIPQRMQISALAADRGNALLAVLDASGDGRLSLREIRLAPERLKQFDKNADGQISAEEIPGSLSLTFSQGPASYGNQMRVVRQVNDNVQAAKPAASPDWFDRMDRNSDGDITAREFLGTAEQFAQLDADGDGFLTREEAAQK